jgi:4-hydroxybenzoate polyprenyltransferase
MVFEAFRLMRLDKPVGIFLLWWPTAWALWIANEGRVRWSLLLWFSLGTILMRSAGCVMNDIADRRIDLHVKRTAQRPLTTGQLSLLQAWFIFLGLLVLAFLVLIQLPTDCFYYALIALFLCGLYPFCKRFLASPQTILALAFSMGIPMAYVASAHALDVTMWTLVLINLLWVLAYDTLYACVDLADDERIGVRSTARLWGKNTDSVVLCLHLLIQGIWLGLAMQFHAFWFFAVAWLLGSYNFWKQHQLIKQGTPEAYFQAFRLNVWYGCWMWLGVVGLYFPASFLPI